MDDRNIGEFLARDRIESSPYVLAMKRDVYCEQLCVSDLGHPEQKGESVSHINTVARAIRKRYHNNWIIDNLPAALRLEGYKTVSTRYWQGFPIGYVSDEDNMAYIYNHVNLIIRYHRVEKESGMYRIVRFAVQPFSIKHHLELAEDDGNNSDGSKVVKFIDPIQSCDPNRKSKVHTDCNMSHMITNSERKPKHTGYYSFLSFFGLKPQLKDDMIPSLYGRKPQLASGKVLFTYDVIWIENESLESTSRWDIYLAMDHGLPAMIRWESMYNSFIVAFGLSAIIVVILNRDIARFAKIATDEEETADREAFGWKAVHADVFRPPTFSPLLLSVACGTGAQILCSSVLTIILAAVGFVGPARRGSLLMAALFLFVMMGAVAGYVTARFYKTFTGTSCHEAAMCCTSLGVPGICFTVFYVLDRVTPAQGRAHAIPFSTMAVLLVLWCATSVPLVLFGSHLGYQQEKIKFPLSTSSSMHRQIPDQPRFTGLPLGLASGGILAFGVCFVELYYILCSIWTRQYYCTFGFLLLVYVVLIVTCAEASALFCYFQLRRENYRWWWSSFCTGGSPALYVFCYSCFYFKQLETNGFEEYVYCFGYMGLGCFGLFLTTGVIGVFGSLWFNKMIYSSIKIGGGK